MNLHHTGIISSHVSLIEVQYNDALFNKINHARKWLTVHKIANKSLT